MKLPFDDAVAALRATVLDSERKPEYVHVVTDTRTIAPGDTFLALRGERFDGHDYVAQAVEKGAAAVVLSDASAAVPGVTALVVADTLRAYMALAAFARTKFRGRVLGITGSAGKTTTKVLAAQLLALKYGTRVLASPANENNEIGVSKLLLSARNDAHDVLVVEMGARHYGDIAALVEVAKPDIAVLTNVGDAHVEVMGSRERLEETKWAIFGQGARAVLNAGDAASIRRAPDLRRSVHWFIAVAEDGDIPTNGRVTAIAGTRHLLEIDGGRMRTYDIDARLPGAHNRSNLAAASAAALEFGVEADALAASIADLTMPSGRYERLVLPSGVTIIYDAYNANAAGMMAALETFASETSGRRIALLASMAELGEEAPALHERVGRHAARTQVDLLLVGGEFAAELANGALREGLSSERIVPFATNAQAAQWVREHARPGDAILLKGSRKYRLEEIVEELRQ